jgi:hypothetical protein
MTNLRLSSPCAHIWNLCDLSETEKQKVVMITGDYPGTAQNIARQNWGLWIRALGLGHSNPTGSGFCTPLAKTCIDHIRFKESRKIFAGGISFLDLAIFYSAQTIRGLAHPLS